MINLLPPSAKQDMYYSKLNRVMLRYVIVSVIVAVVAIGSLIGGEYVLKQRTNHIDAEIASKQVEIAKQLPLQRNAAAISARVKAIESIQASQAHYSQLLTDLSQYMPTGAAITSIGLTGDDTKPVKVTVSAPDYVTAVAFRDSIAKSKRISAADIQVISTTAEASTITAAPYEVTLTFSFTKGSAK